MSTDGNITHDVESVPSSIDDAALNAPSENAETPSAVDEVSAATEGAVADVMGESFDAHLQAREQFLAQEASAAKNRQTFETYKQGAKTLKQFEKSTGSTTESASIFTTALDGYLKIGKVSHMMDLYKKDPAAYNEFIENYINNSGNLALAVTKGLTDFPKSTLQRFARMIPGTDSVKYLTDAHTVVLVNFMVASGVLPAPEHIAKQAEEKISKIIMHGSAAVAALGMLSSVTGIGAIGGVPLTAVAGLAGTVDQLVYRDFIKGLAKERKARAGQHIQAAANKAPEQAAKVIDLSVPDDYQAAA